MDCFHYAAVPSCLEGNDLEHVQEFELPNCVCVVALAACQKPAQGGACSSGQLRLAHICRSLTQNWVPGAWGSSQLLTLHPKSWLSTLSSPWSLQTHSPLLPSPYPLHKPDWLPDTAHCALNSLLQCRLHPYTCFRKSQHFPLGTEGLPQWGTACFICDQ